MNKKEHALSRGLFYLLTCLVLAACGSGGDDSVPLQGISAYKLSTTLTSSTVAPAGSTVVTVTLKDANGNAAPGQTISLSKTGGASLGTGSLITDATGKATTTLSGNNAGQGSGGTVDAIYVDSSGSTAKSSASYSVLDSENVILTLSKTTVNSGTGDSVALTGVVLDSSGQVLSNKTITFAVSGGFTNGSIVSSGSTSATYSPSTTDLSNKQVTVTAAVAGSAATASAVINVVGTTVQITSPTTAVTLNDTVTLQGFLKDGSGNGIGNTSVLLTSANLPGTSQTITTLANGSFPSGITATITSTTGGVATFTASALGATSTLSLTVSGTSFSFTAPAANAEIPVNTATPVTITHLSNGSPVAGTLVYFSTSLGTVSSPTATTNAAGQATVNVSSTSAGQAVISANTTGAALLASRTALFVSSTPASISVQAGQTGLVANAQTTITATVLDAASNPVKGKVVEFSVISDPSNGPGLSASTATTDASGKASVSYTAGSQTTATNAVQIKAKVQGTTIETKTPPTTPSHALLTVGGSALFLSITSGKTLETVNSTIYSEPRGIIVTDALGNPVANKVIGLSVIPSYYYKGYYVNKDPANPATTYSSWTPYYTATCVNEDTNVDGNIGAGEDINNNGRLDPGNPVTLSAATVTTNAQGIASFSVIYGMNYGSWLRVKLKATAGVSGTESVAELSYILSILADDAKLEEAPPGGGPSPFGIATVCTDPN